MAAIYCSLRPELKSAARLLAYNILKETSNAKSERMLLECTPRFCLRPVLYDMRLVNIFIIVMYDVMSYLFLTPNLVASFTKLHEI